MLDIRLIRKDRAAVEAKLKTKEPTIDLTTICELDQKIREAKTNVEQLKARRNEVSQQIGEIKRSGGDIAALMAEVASSAETIHTLDHAIRTWEEQLTDALSRLPNLPMDDVPVSQHPQDNVVLKTFGTQPTFSFPFKNHVELNEKLNLFDFKRGAKLAGSGWPVYRGMGARLEWALLQYMLNYHVQKGFTQWIPPLLVRREMMFGAGQLPKFDNQQFKIQDDDYHLYLIPTAEIPLTGLHADEILSAEELPLRYVAYTPCFRREAGAAGSQERGLIRVHQFNKVEMYCYTHPEDSVNIFNQMVASAEEILEGLELHYRSMLLVTGDMSFAAAKTIDVEVWLPGQNRYYEVSSISNCKDYQSRRANIRFKQGSEKPEYLHTLNGSGLATSRLMVALLENNQCEDGSINIPKALQPYLNNQTVLTPS